MLFYLFTAILAMIFVKKYGRKYLTLVGSIGIAGTLYLISIAYFISSLYRIFSQILIVTSLIAYLLVYGITYAPVMWMWVSEALLPHTIGYAIMINWSGAALIMILFPILLNYMPDNNPGYIFLFFGIYVTLSIYVTRIMMI